MTQESKTTNFWQKFVGWTLAYFFVGAIVIGMAAANFENKCGYIRKTSSGDDAMALLIWLPGTIGWGIETKDTVPLCKTVVK